MMSKQSSLTHGASIRREEDGQYTNENFNVRRWNQRTAMKSNPHSPQLEKACAQQQRPNGAKKKKKKQQTKTMGLPWQSSG